MNDIVKHNGAAAFGVPAPTISTDAMAAALQQASREVSTGQTYLRMDKTGTWVVGADLEPVGKQARFAIDPFSFGHGYIAWGDLKKLGEAFVPLTTALPPPPPVPEGARGWDAQMGMMVKHANPADAAEDLGVLIFRTSAFGGRKAIAALASEVGKRMASGQPSMPIVLLNSTFYKHDKYGRIYEPEFIIENWVGGIADIAGLLEGKESAPAKKAAKRAKPAARKAA